MSELRHHQLRLLNLARSIVGRDLCTEDLSEVTETLGKLTFLSTGRKVGFQLVFLEQHDISAQLNPLIDEVFRLGMDYHKLMSATEKQSEFDKVNKEMLAVREKISRLLMQ